MKKLITLTLLLAITVMGKNIWACEVEVAEQSRETLKKYVETIINKEQDRAAFGKVIAETLISAASCDSLPLPVSLEERRGYYQGLFVIFQYAGIENAAARPSLKSVDESYNRLMKAQEGSKK